MDDRKRKALWNAAGYVLALLAIYFAARHAGVGLGQIHEYWRAVSVWHWLACLLLFLSHILMNAVAFSVLLAGPSPSERVSRAAYRNIWLGSVLAKYVPGAVWQIAGRGVLMNKHGLPVRAGVVAGIAEQVISLFWCLLIFLTAVAAFRSYEMPAILLVVTVCAAHLLPGFVSTNLVSAATVRRVCAASIIYGASMVPFAMGYLMILLPGNWLELTAAIFGGTVAGTIAFFSPGGLGVRESVSSLLVDQMISAQVLSGMAGARVLIVLAEFCATIFGLTRLRGSKL